MSDKLVPKVILEGTRLTHKTELAFALNEHPRFVGPRKYRYHSPVVSAEWCGFTNYPWGRGLINFAEDEESQAMETYATWVRLFELQRYYSWIVDRFHISTRLFQRAARGIDYDFRWLEERLVNLNFRLIFVTRTPDSFELARSERIKISGKPSQYDDLQVFIDQQEDFRELVAKSKLENFEVDISDGDVGLAADRVCNYMESTGGMTLEE